jgi:hypothetical protein
MRGQVAKVAGDRRGYGRYGSRWSVRWNDRRGRHYVTFDDDVAAHWYADRIADKGWDVEIADRDRRK